MFQRRLLTLPMNELFLKRMESLLKEDYPAYLNTLNEPFHRGLRVNTLKITPKELKRRLPFELKPTRISDTVFTISNELKQLGTSFEHRAGLYYLQEVSAASAVEVLDPQPGQWVLDLCAAPGGKSTQIAMKMKNQGILFANEVDSGRAQILLSNIERCGISNAVITNASISALKEIYAGAMDRILVDAPCSGEGMFKKESEALKAWSLEHVRSCAIRQGKILEDAVGMLKEDGRLVYSTCTYSIEENEAVINELLKHHPEMEQLDCGVEFGRPGVDLEYVSGKKVRRIFPMEEGEGHFVALLHKKGKSTGPLRRFKRIAPSSLALIDAFLKEQLDEEFGLLTTVLQDKVYLSAFEFFDFKGIRVLRQGILAGEIRKGRFEPHQHFYVSALFQSHFLKQLDCNEEEIGRIIHGETLNKPVRGFYALANEGIVFAFGKGDGTTLKNRYPKGLRSH